MTNYETICLADLDPDVFGYGDATVLVSHGDHTYRITWEADHYAEAPDWDGLTPMVYLDRSYTQTYDHASEILRAWGYFGLDRVSRDPYDMLQRYLRIYFGASTVHYATLGSVQGSPTAVFFDTPEWRELTGWEPSSLSARNARRIGEPLAMTEQDDPARQTAKTWQAYASGEVYGFTLERLVTGQTVWEDGSGSDAERWDHLDSCHGFYGQSELAYVITDHIKPAIESED